MHRYVTKPPIRLVSHKLISVSIGVFAIFLLFISTQVNANEKKLDALKKEIFGDTCSRDFNNLWIQDLCENNRFLEELGSAEKIKAVMVSVQQRCNISPSKNKELILASCSNDVYASYRMIKTLKPVIHAGDVSKFKMPPAKNCKQRNNPKTARPLIYLSDMYLENAPCAALGIDLMVKRIKETAIDVDDQRDLYAQLNEWIRTRIDLESSTPEEISYFAHRAAMITNADDILFREPDYVTRQVWLHNEIFEKAQTPETQIEWGWMLLDAITLDALNSYPRNRAFDEERVMRVTGELSKNELTKPLALAALSLYKKFSR